MMQFKLKFVLFFTVMVVLLSAFCKNAMAHSNVPPKESVGPLILATATGGCSFNSPTVKIVLNALTYSYYAQRNRATFNYWYRQNGGSWQSMGANIPSNHTFNLTFPGVRPSAGNYEFYITIGASDSRIANFSLSNCPQPPPQTPAKRSDS
jgi:hypothetical protein